MVVTWLVGVLGTELEFLEALLTSKPFLQFLKLFFFMETFKIPLGGGGEGMEKKKSKREGKGGGGAKPQPRRKMVFHPPLPGVRPAGRGAGRKVPFPVERRPD